MERSVNKKLVEWADKKNAKPLILRGARQVGKTYLARSLKSKFDIFIELNLEKESDSRHFADAGLDAKYVLESVLLKNNQSYQPERTLLFIDEIQEEPRAIQMLRYFYEEIPGLHVIAAGSLLEFAYSEIESFPVGRVEQLSIHPMNFEEFLMALGETRALEYYHQIPTPEIADHRLFALFNSYMAIGGMPEAIMSYISNDRSIVEIEDVFSSIWDAYQSDIEKYARSSSERKAIRYIVSNLAPVGERIQYARYGNSDYGSRVISEAFSDLEKARIFSLIYPTTNTVPPITENRKRKPRLQFLDTGLLNHANAMTSTIYLQKGINAKAQGKLIEHVMFQELLALNSRVGWQPRFWVRENSNSSAEVDAVIQKGDRIYPIEAKSGKKGTLKSLSEFMDRTNHDIAFRILNNSYAAATNTTRQGKDYKLVNIPYYSIGKIESWIDYANGI